MTESTSIARIESCMSLYVEMRSNGQVMGNATGIVGITPGGRPALLTNWHIVTGKRPDTGELLDLRGRIPDELKITHNADVSDEQQIDWVERFERLYGDHQEPLWHEHPVHGNKVDVVALPLTQLDGVKLRPYLGPGAPDWPNIQVGPADRVSVIGFPFGLTAGGPADRAGEWGALAIWATGFVVSETEVNYRDLPLFLVDCRARTGQSGSAVIGFGSVISKPGVKQFITGGHVSRFLGLYSGRINKESDLGMVWKTTALLDILAALHS